MRPFWSAREVRTNEILFAFPWELREFRIGSSLLGQVTVAQTPDLSFDNTPFLRGYLNPPRPASPPIPLFVGTTPFRAGSSLVPDPFFHWKTPATLTTERRHLFSNNTCSGCHAGETETMFTHVAPAFTGPPSLSKFLIGDSSNNDGYHDVLDPAGSTAIRKFFDLDRRREDLDNLINSNCFVDVLRRAPSDLGVVH